LDEIFFPHFGGQASAIWRKSQMENLSGLSAVYVHTPKNYTANVPAAKKKPQ
jgi:hypothetical protein